MNIEFFQQPDEILVREYQVSQDPQYLEVLFYRHKDKLLRSILFWGIPRDEAENIAQEAMYKSIDSLNKGKYQAENKFFPWMLRIARNLMIDIKRREKRGREILNEDIKPMAVEHSEDLEDTIVHRLQNELLAENLQICLAEIPVNQKQIIEMRIYRELSFKEISTELGISINTALGRMRYGLINLRKVWEAKAMVH